LKIELSPKEAMAILDVFECHGCWKYGVDIKKTLPIVRKLLKIVPEDELKYYKEMLE